MVKNFEDLEVWQDGFVVCKQIFEIFNDFKIYSLKDQMFRSAVSIISNIAEGFDCSSDKEFKRFLYIAKGSVSELRAQLMLVKELNCEESIHVDGLLDALIILSKKIYKFTLYLEKNQ